MSETEIKGQVKDAGELWGIVSGDVIGQIINADEIVGFIVKGQ